MTEQLPCLRSLWETLTAAASTFALFAAANWGTAGIIGVDPHFFSQIMGHTFYVLAVPFNPLHIILRNASEVWMVKSILGREKYSPHYDTASIAIITLCPLYIQIPMALASEDQLGPLLTRGCRLVTDSDALKDVCPLELRPRQAAGGGTSPNYTGGATEGTVSHDTTAVLRVEDSSQWRCLQLPDTSRFSDFRNASAFRLALLILNLAPTRKELSFIRSRNTFQSVVITLQAGGYMLSVVQRVVQRLGISPVEAIVTFLCIIVTLQLVIELYACGNYQRPLLIRLDAGQFESFRGYPLRTDFQAHKRDKAVVALLIVMWVIISTPAIYYYSHYMHSYLLCAVSALLFFLAQTLFAIGLIVANIFTIDYMLLDMTLGVGSVLLYACSIIVAVVSTIVDWKAFHSPIPHNWFAWILPHASS